MTPNQAAHRRRGNAEDRPKNKEQQKALKIKPTQQTNNNYPEEQPKTGIKNDAQEEATKPEKVPARRGANENIKLQIHANRETGKKTTKYEPKTHQIDSESNETMGIENRKAPKSDNRQQDLQGNSNKLENVKVPKGYNPKNPKTKLNKQQQYSKLMEATQRKATEVAHEADKQYCTQTKLPG
ncbi:hypothetical protein [Escherichia coli]|uniref:hypothetical protein n=1 Tax=Escherichia coli TaxID=562 RepID=UPI0007E8FB23|nr:hypothetical protein [Escherichia coli]